MSLVMASDHPNSSWNPAFRPNSAATSNPVRPSGSPRHPPFIPNATPQLDSTEEIPVSISTVKVPGHTGSCDSTHIMEDSATGDVSSQNEDQHKEPIVENPIEIEAIVEEADEGEKQEEEEEEEEEEKERSNHAELENLRSALTTSLASPGGVEMEDHPLHTTNQEEATDTSYSLEQEKGDIPSKGPAQEYGVRHSAFFARTIPQDVDWGEDDDPEWNIQRTDTDPFKLMANADRSNSFPQVPPTHHPELDSEQPGQSTGPARQLLTSLEEHTDGFLSQRMTNEGKEISDLGNASLSVDETEHTHYGDRYEEGLPLVGQPLEHAGQDAAEVQQGKSISFMEDIPGEEVDFFAEIGTSSSNEEVSEYALERKSTMQVIDSLHFQPQEEDEVSTPIEEEKTNTQTSLEKSSGGGIATSKSTILSQIFGEPDSDVLFGKGPDNAFGHAQPSEEDLAAKWKAALDGDEFLDDEDDEFLEDHPESGTGATDLAAIFGSDDEGFLDDDEVDEATFIEQKSPPASSSVTGPDGQVIGFDNLTNGGQANQYKNQNRYLPANGAQAAPQLQAPNNPYTPSGPLFTNPTTPAATSNSHLYGSIPPSASATSPAANYAVQALSQTQDTPKAQSFVDRAKGGYTSPYDLPMEVVKPRKRPSIQHLSGGYKTPAPPSVMAPPRSSSMYSQPSPSNQASTPLMPPQSFSDPSQAETLPPKPQAIPHTLKSKSSFFEELPSAPKPKPAGRHTPQPGSSFGLNGSSTAPPQANSQYVPPVPPPQSSGYGLITPPQVSPYASLQTPAPAAPVISNRYSPAPNTQSASIPSAAANQSRYASAPPLRQQHPPYSGPGSASSPILAHQPRTSSPLAHFERSQEHRSYSGSTPTAPVNNMSDRKTSSGYEPVSRGPVLPTTPELSETPIARGYDPRTNVGMAQQRGPPLQAHPRPMSSGNYAPSQLSQSPPATAANFNLSPPKRATSGYLPEQSGSFSQEQGFEPPKRSQTQSPGRLLPAFRPDMAVADPYQRPVSVANPTSPKRVQEPYSSISAEVQVPKTRSRGFSQGLHYIAPVDGRELDPLQRWRGGPVFAWGVGGTVITSFPKEVPRYGIGQALPMIICSPGEVKVRSLKDIFPLEGRLANFPGPLKGKSKKKEVVSWLTAGIEMLERDNSYLQGIQGLAHEDKRKEERVLLWKVLRVMIENDGVLEGNPSVNTAVRAVLSPGLDVDATGAAPQYGTSTDLLGIHRLAGSVTQAEPVDPTAVDALRQHLLRGEREKAVWEAVDKRLWAHAMLISNTLSKDLYRQVAQEFVQKEVKSIGENTESLAALYEVFAGNFEESIDELVPPSARAGFQMVSTAGSTGQSKGALDGLDRWRETLGLILSNRSPDDNQAINALGKLLSGYGRAEAAHICFLFARSHSIFGGVDDPSSNIVLVGSDHLRQPLDFEKELEPVLLSEVYEYALMFSATSNMPSSSPHLAAYKLQHATILAEMGQRDKALQYCEAIESTITSQTRRSPYHHAQLISALDDLSKRLKQSPKDESSSWISKPSIDKVSTSVWTKFNNFVAGDENDASSTAIGEPGADVGPFARIAGGTPTISRSPSIAEIYVSQTGAPSINGAMPIPAAARAASRYAPGGSYTPPSTHDYMPSSFGSQPTGSSYPMNSQLDHSFGDRYGPAQTSDPRAPMQSTSTQFGHSDLRSDYGAPPVHNPYSPVNQAYNSSQYTLSNPSTPVDAHAGSSLYGAGYTSQGFDSKPPITSYTPPDSFQPHSIHDSYKPQNNGGYTPPEIDVVQSSNGIAHGIPELGGYQPPESSGYEPPSYEPAMMGDEPDSPIDTKPKKKSFLDDHEEDDYVSDHKTTEKTKAEKDKEVDDAFRKAAEADGKSAKLFHPINANIIPALKAIASAPAKKGWGLGGWFGGAKKEAAPEVAVSNKPIKAKLGEASSFYYDPDLKRWVNKKAGKDDPTASPGATPPPPRSAPPRAVSGSGFNTPPATTPRSGSPSGLPPMSGSMGPPQRAVSATSAPMIIGDGSYPDGILHPTLQPPSMARSVSNGSATGPPSRPGTSMSNASSIDDLLGPPMARKGGAKKTKKGRGYIDVMGDKTPVS
jgi:hypothetical protein